MKRLVLLVASLVLIPLMTTVSGLQPGQTTTLHYDVAVAPSVVSTYTQRITVNGTVLTAAPVCGPLQDNQNQTTCFVPVTLNPTNNTISVAFTLNNQESETRITGLDLNTVPASPSNPRAKVTIIINIGG